MTYYFELVIGFQLILVVSVRSRNIVNSQKQSVIETNSRKYVQQLRCELQISTTNMSCITKLHHYKIDISRLDYALNEDDPT